MSGVRAIALISGVVSTAVIVGMVRRRQLKDRFAALWLASCVVILVFGIDPALFNRLAHGVGVASPPSLLAVLASLFLLVVLVYFSWDLGRLEERARTLAEELALLRHEIEQLRRRPPQTGRAPATGHHPAGGVKESPARRDAKVHTEPPSERGQPNRNSGSGA